MLANLYTKLIDFIVDSSIKYKYRILVITLLISLPCLYLVRQITIDTDLLKLLPEDNPAVIATKDLAQKVGDGGHFIVLFEGDNTEQIKKAVESTAEKLRNLEGIKDVQYKYPTEFINKFNYALVPNEYIKTIYDKALTLESKLNPFADLGDDEEVDKSKDTAAKTQGEAENELEMSVMLRRYAGGSEYHQSPDGKTFAVLIPTKQGITSLGSVKELYDKISAMNAETEKEFGVKTHIGGNHANKLIDYDTITRDLDIATIISVSLIVLLLIYSFRGFWSVILVLFPLVVGLLWSFALVPVTFGSLNLITSFLTVILFGLGADFPIHIIKRFQIESENHDLRTALRLSFGDTGLSVIISAITSAAGFAVAILSHFRGFYEFGILSTLSIIAIMLAMFIPFPSALIIIAERGGIKKLRPVSKRVWLPGKAVTALLVLITLTGGFFAYKWLAFDYFLSNTDFKRDNYKNYQAVNEKIESVYSATTSPAAIYACPSIESLDKTLQILKNAKSDTASEINRLQSIRDFAPDTKEFAERKEMLGEMKEIFANIAPGDLPDSNIRTLIGDFNRRIIPDSAPTFDQIPSLIADNLLGNRGSGYYLVNVYPKHERKDGRVAMALTRELSKLNMPAGVKGPVGETIVFADVLETVLGEAWQIVLWGQLLVFLVVIVFQRNIKQTLLMFIPLIAGMLVMFGIYGLLDIKITFFSVICIPALMGMGVDGGIHYINRLAFRNKDLRLTQRELFEPLTSAYLTVIFGYIGMTISAHSGLQSIGLLSALGMLCIWLMNLVLLPGLLKFSQKSGK